MVTLQDLKRISDYEWEIPQSFREDMRVPVRLFATRRMLEEVMKDKSLEQAVNAATLPGLVGHVMVMPDMHQGYGFPIGGVAATRLPDGVISPGGIGYDINCGVRLLGSQISLRCSPATPGCSSPQPSTSTAPAVWVRRVRSHVTDAELEAVCRQGSRWALKQGFASEADLRRTEESGCVEGADPDKVSPNVPASAADRSLARLGAGNHFIEVDLVEQVFDTTGCLSDGFGTGQPGSADPLRLARLRSPDLHRLRGRIPGCGAAAMTSTWSTASWCALRSTRPKGRITWLPCAVPPTMPLPTARCWRTAPARPSSRCWQAR